MKSKKNHDDKQIETSENQFQDEFELVDITIEEDSLPSCEECGLVLNPLEKLFPGKVTVIKKSDKFH